MGAGRRYGVRWQHTKKMVDELKLPWDSPPPVPTTLAEALLTELPATDFNRNLSRLNAAKLDKPPPYRSFLGTPLDLFGF